MAYSEEQIKEQLEKILDSQAFLSSQVLTNFLTYIVEKTLAGEQIRLKAYTIATEALGKGEDFNALNDSFVRTYAGKLRKELQNYYLTTGKNDSIFIDVPKGQYIPRFTSLDDAKENYARLQQKNTNLSKVKKNKSKFWRAVLVCFLLSLVLFFYFLLKDDFQKSKQPQIVFTHFKNLTGNEHHDLWIKGLTDELITISSRYEGLTILGPIEPDNQDAFLKLKNEEPIYSVTGSLNQLDSILVIHVQLKSLKKGEVLWAETYRSQVFGNSLAMIENKICSEIAAKTSSIYGIVQNEQLINHSSNSNSSFEGHLLILKFYQYLRNLDESSHKSLSRQFQKLTVKEPEFAEAWAFRAGLLVDGYTLFGLDSLSAITQASKFVNKAEKLDANNLNVQSIKWLVAYVTRNEIHFNQAIDKALTLNPKAIMLGEMGVFLVLKGDEEKGIPLVKEAIKNSLVYPGYFHIGLAIQYYRDGDFENMLKESEKVDMPDFYVDYLFRILALINLNKLDEAKQVKIDLLTTLPHMDTNRLKDDLVKLFYLDADINRMLLDYKKVVIE